MTIGDTDVDFKIDTGADVSVIPAKTWKKLQPKLKPQESTARLESPGGPVLSLGQFIARTNFKGRQVWFRTFVIVGEADCILARSVGTKLGVIKKIDSN